MGMSEGGDECRKAGGEQGIGDTREDESSIYVVQQPEHSPHPIVNASGMCLTDRRWMTVRTTPSGAAYMAMLKRQQVHPTAEERAAIRV